jgi:hypothetical protein
MTEANGKRAPYLKTLQQAHEVLRPGAYLEIGSRYGDSLFLADCPTIAIDPVNQLRRPLRADDQFFEMTSDVFFESYRVSELVRGPIDLAFIDGMHLAEYALRDFINIEANMPPSGAILIDDVLPGKADYAGRQPETRFWTGDVYKLIRILLAMRPDLRIDVFSVPVKGLALVRNLDPGSGVLRDAYPKLEQDIQADRWNLTSVEDLRAEFAAQHPEQLAAVLRS